MLCRQTMVIKPLRILIFVFVFHSSKKSFPALSSFADGIVNRTNLTACVDARLTRGSLT